MSISVEKGQNLKVSLKNFFGYGEFRGNQEKIIDNIIAGNDTFVIMPTGAGKSLCYQLPAIMSEGTAIVISPLIALMKNQVDQLNSFGINAAFLNSTLTKTEINRVKKETLNGNLKLLYVAPESLTKPDNIAFLQGANISFVAIDEAHCISEWGHDFRPEYRKIRQIIDAIGELPVIALTATATPKVQLDIKKNLRMDDSTVFKSSFNRTNLYYEVRPKLNSKKQLIQYVKQHEGKSGIIYCLSRKKVESVAEFLRVNDVNAAPYHAGMEPATRIKNQEDFLNEKTDVIVATIAFGMGIDKPDVRFVIHYDVPKSIEGYYQETGRAGRDGLEGKCLLFYSYKDILKLDKFNKDKPVTERDNARHLLEEMVAYSESTSCRRVQLLHYFGEIYTGGKCLCDNCQYPKEPYEGKELGVLIIETVKQTGERFGVTHLANVIKGSANQYVKSYGHDKLDVYGKGKDKSVEEWAQIIRQIMLQELLDKDIENYGVLKVSKKGEAFLKAPHSIQITKDHDYSALPEDDEDVHETLPTNPYDKVLFEALKTLRRKIGEEKGFPPYVIFQDPSLEEMATTFPTNIQDLAHVHGVGQGKANKFGKPFVEFISKYIEENNIATAVDVFVKSAVNKSKIKISIIQGIDKKIDLEEIAESQGIAYPKLIEEIEHICYSGTKLNIDYHIESLLDDDRQEEIFDYFMEAETDKISDALDEFENEYSEEELRLMRVKFLSEVAN